MLQPMNNPSPPPNEVSIWAEDLRTGTMPWICVKSGKPASTTVRVQFQNSDKAAYAGLIPGLTTRRSGELQVIRGKMPVTAAWSLAISSARLFFIAALVGVGWGIWQTTVASRSSTSALVVLVASVLIVQVYMSVRGRLEVSGVVYNGGAGDTWVRVRGVHPKFVAAVEASRIQAPTAAESVRTPDLTPVPAKRNPPAWLVWIGLTALWAVFGIGAWIRFHG